MEKDELRAQDGAHVDALVEQLPVDRVHDVAGPQLPRAACGRVVVDAADACSARVVHVYLQPERLCRQARHHHPKLLGVNLAHLAHRVERRSRAAQSAVELRRLLLLAAQLAAEHAQLEVVIADGGEESRHVGGRDGEAVEADDAVVELQVRARGGRVVVQLRHEHRVAVEAYSHPDRLARRAQDRRVVVPPASLVATLGVVGVVQTAHLRRAHRRRRTHDGELEKGAVRRQQLAH